MQPEASQQEAHEKRRAPLLKSGHAVWLATPAQSINRRAKGGNGFCFFLVKLCSNGKRLKGTLQGIWNQGKKRVDNCISGLVQRVQREFKLPLLGEVALKAILSTH
jgi:hypothetical protein